ncbi:pseudouridine-5'-phosphate glycosidase [Thermosipho ferrireducens]|uniref:Pseudouridine-5'-phosphate glycosidase n=1 Tax=Thermosipho ferrireducens TaxID=2571116 RepID=A0ABX7S451_9BACT|nr:pseudouridine-5'-phosphate glycosidase [Thermosipho ferrireducens]QTA37194.1 pseudouridine-5'-phosphate glycosidase [Thermosipho ferrireducens]
MRIREEIINALKNNLPVVAFESTVIAHGLPYPKNLEIFRNLENIAREMGCIPATIGIFRGEIVVGLTEKEIVEFIEDSPVKVGTREIPYVCALKKSAATTVSATAKIASLSGIKVFATGGIGGVHKGEWDVSQDLLELSKTNIIVVSTGCKSILDVKKTLEFLETFQVIVVGYKTEYFPIFYNGISSYKIDRVDSVEHIRNIYNIKNEISINGSILVANPIPEEYVISEDEMKKYLSIVEKEMDAKNISGKDVTPYTLKRLVELSKGKTLEANITLLENNAKLACDIAKSLVKL